MLIVSGISEMLRRATRRREQRELLSAAEVAQWEAMPRGPVLQTPVERKETRRRVEAELAGQRERREMAEIS